MKYKLLRYSLLSMLVMLCGGGIFAIGQALSKANDAVVFEDTFSDLEDTAGGGDTSFTGSNSGTKITEREGWTTLTNVYQGQKCVRIGTSNNPGTFTSDAIELTGDGVLTFEMAGWGSGTNTMAVTVTGADASGDTNLTLDNGTYGTYTVNLTNAEGSVKISFSGKRGFLRSVKVASGAGSTDNRAATELVIDSPVQTGIVGESAPLPSATVKELTGAPVSDAEITWTSSNTAVATIADGTINFLAAGTSTIKASFAGNDSYKASNASFTLTVTEPAIVDPAGVMTIQFKESGTESDSSTKQTTIEGIISQGAQYISAVDATNVYQGRIGRGAKLGTSSASGSLTLTLTESVNPTKITFKARYYNENETKITVNGNDYDALTADFDEYTISYDGETPVRAIIISTPEKRAYITEVVIYTAAAEEPATPVEWPEGVEGETWKINTTVAMPTQSSGIPVTGQDCKVAYLTDAAEAYLNISISGITVIAKGTVDADKNVTIPAGQIVGQYMNQPAAIFAQGATTGGQEDVVFTYSETDEKISLTNASFCVALGQAATVTLSNTEIYKEKPAPAAADYYVVGNMTEWGVKADYQMTKNEQAETEEYMFTMDLTTQSQFKVVKSDGVSQTWYPDGMGNNYGENGEITKDGNYTIYFRPKADGGDDWFYGVIYAAANETPVEDNAIWSSDQAVYCENITVEASKFANVTVGDILHVIVEGTNADSEYNSHVRILNGNGKQLENGVNVGKQPDGTDVGFVLTGDILTQLKATGLKLGGYGYSSKLITVESTETTGSDASIWVGASTGNIDMSNLHFANFNDFAGVKKGDIIRVTLDASNWVSGTSGWVNLQYKSGDGGWDWKNTQDTDLVEITNHWNGDPVEILINSDELAAEMNDAAKNHGVVVQAGEATIITQVELIPAPVTVDNLWIVGDEDGWQISTEVNLPNLKAMTFNEETQAFEYEVSVLNSDGFYFAFGDVASSDSWDDFNENHRYAARNEEVEVVENQPIQLQKCAGTLKITTEGVYTLSVTKDLMLSIKKTGEIEPVTTDKLYVIGDMNDWDRTAMTEMTVNSAGNYEYELTTEADCYFAFATKQLTAEEAEADPNWEVFSANYRWTIAAGNTEAELDHEYELQKADGNVVLHAGQYTVIVTPDMKMIITGTPSGQPTEFEYSAVYVAGNGADKNWLNGASWDAGAEANKLTEVADDVWEITLENVAAGEGYEFKFTVDGGWNVNFGIEDPTAFAFGTEYPGVVNGANIKFSLTEASDVTMHLDMSAYDNTTKQGAKFTVTATAAGEEPVEDEGLWITWGEDDLCDKGSAASQYGDSEDFYLTCVDSENSKLQVDANVAYFGTADAQKKFTHRLKTSGKSTNKNNLTLHIAKAGKLNVYVRAGNSEATDRKLVLTQGTNELYSKVVQDADAIQVAEADLNVSAPALDEVVYKSVYPVISVDVEEGDVLVGYPDNGLNFYGFQLIPDDGPITGIRNIEVTENPMFDESLPAYNLQGQRVTKSYRGVVIQNGRKFYNK